MINDFYKKYNIYLLAGLASFILTLIMLSYNQPFNKDGILYLKTAEVFAKHGVRVALSFHDNNWIFYSVLIALTSKLTTLSFLHAAYLLDAILDAATIVLFITLIKELGGSRKIQIISALVILLFPHINFYRHNILRGHGYYLFALLAILFLIRFYKNDKWRDTIGWGIAITLATLFRIEGAVLACFLPLVLIFKPDLKFLHKIKYILKAYIIQIIILILIISYVAYSGSSQLSRLSEFTGQLSHGFQNTWDALQNASHIITTQVLGFHLFRYGMAYFLTGALVAVYIGFLLSTIGLLYLILSIYSIAKKIVMADWSAKAVWLYSILLNIIITAIFLCQRLYLTERYVTLLCLLLLMTIPFALERIYKSRWFVIVAIMLIYTAVGSIYNFGPSKTYVVKAGQWINNNTPPTAKLYSTNIQCSYYAHRQTEEHPNKKTNYFVFDIARHDKKSEKKLLAALKLKPIKEFHNSRGNKILIFKNVKK
jgi:hypothetical protein